MKKPGRSKGKRILALLAGPATFALLWLLAADLPGAARNTLAITGWVAIWWIFEAVPIPVASLLPLVLIPATGVRPAREVAGLYLSDLVFLLLGGFLLALMIERWNLHRRIALAVLQSVGTSPRRLVLGFLLASAGLSMWISNSATSLMLIPIALAVTHRLAAEGSSEGRFEVALLLAVAYGANCGGMATYVGTPPNLVFRERYEADFATGAEGAAPAISFLQWMLLGLPLLVALLPLVWFVLTRKLGSDRDPRIEQQLREERSRLPSWSEGELWAMGVFAVTALLWVTRQPLVIGERQFLGWIRLFPEGVVISDATVAIGMALLAFVVRARREPLAQPEPLLEWKEAERKLPWGIVFLLGAGMVLGDCFKSSGLTVIVGETLAAQFSAWSSTVVMGSVALVVSLITEVASNTATALLTLQTLSAVAPSLEMTPAALLLPATLAASCAFMMPVATGPNAIVFATGRLRIATMVRHGVVLNLAAVVLITFYLQWVALPLLGLASR